MITLTITKGGQPYPVSVLGTDSRALARALKLLAKENGFDVEATEDVKPRVIKFKGVD